jgi:anhydro-N-acetylmuramic acid kinase
MKILGVMSGTSLDGLDLAVCSFTIRERRWSWEIQDAITIPYPEPWIRKLNAAHSLSGRELQFLHQEYGQFIAMESGSFLASNDLKVEIISSHGHTVFHQPESSFTFQIGDPQVIAAITGIRTIGDFRKLDVLLGGQGAPLVPAGDEYLFGQYDACLNLGGIANISYREGGKRLARDICPVNLILNHLSRELEMACDKDGRAGKSGTLCVPLLEKLNALPYYRSKGPASLGREWLESEFLSCFEGFRIPVTDALRTVYEHIAMQVSRTLRKDSSILFTGGGTYNTFLIDLIREYSKAGIVIPGNQLIEFKEALIFAFLGLLREKNEINCFASVTGAARDSCCGVIFNPS